MQLGGVKQSARRYDVAMRRRCAAFGYACAKLHPVGPTLLGRQTAFHAVCAYLKFKVVARFVHTISILFG